MPSRALAHPQHDPGSRDLERHQPLSWLRCLVSIFSYLLMLSDVPRAGFGLRDLSFYSRIEPDQHIFFGPYAYPVTTQLLRKATHSGPLWPYKYDSTSVAMRAVASHLAIPEWRSACVTYDETCDERAGIPLTTVFRMIDSLIDAVKTHKDVHQPNGRAGRLALRTAYEWSDRLHDYALPWFFSSPNLRTVQASHYDLTLQRPVSLCSSSTRRRRPLTCGESWTNFDRLCAPGNPLCQGVGLVHTHVPTRLHKLLELYPPGHEMDFVLLEGTDDLTRSSLTSDGYKNIDIVVLARIRKCTSSGNSSAATTPCETVLVDDFRYEVVPLVTNAQDWFWIIAMLRGIGQCYAWMRLVLLVAGCYMARADEPCMKQSSYGARAILTVRTLFLLPSQVVVYGSLFPVSCYLAAHLIDAAVVYELMAAHFSTVMGVMSLEFGEILRVCAVSMRSLWLLVFACHIVHRVATQCSWSPIHGAPGIPEFSLSFVASLTILAQVRHPSLRDTRILHIEALVPSATRYFRNNMHSDTSHGFLYKLLFGSPIDFKCLILSLAVLLTVTLLLRSVQRLVRRCFPYQSVLFTHTAVPYSAGSLWPVSSLVVGWNSTFLAKPSPPLESPTDRKQACWLKAVRTRAVQPLHQIACQSTTPQPRTEPFTVSLHHRVAQPHESETLIFLMNLAVMTDPLTFLRLRLVRGQLIGVYTDEDSSTTTHKHPWTPSRICHHSHLLPLALAMASSDIPIDWRDLKLRLVVLSSELEWCDLLQCG